MASNRIKTRSVDPTKAAILFNRGEELFETAVESSENGRWYAS